MFTTKEWMKATDAFTRKVRPKILTILDAYLKPLSDIPARIAAQEIIQFYPPLQQSDASETTVITFLENLWQLFIDAAEQMHWQDSSQDKIIELMKAIRGSPNPTTVNFDNGFVKGELWTDLPWLDIVLTDNVESHGIIINNDSDEEKASCLCNINFQGFAARLTVENLHDVSRLAVFRLRRVLEEGPDHYIAGYDKVGPHLDACIRPVEVWISLAAKVILRFCRANGEGAIRNDLPGGKYWQGKEGFSLERWEFWKQKLDEIAVNQEASKETRNIAKGMKAKMVATKAEA